MKVKNYYWYHVTQYGDGEDTEIYFKTRRDVADYLGITVPQVSYYSNRSAVKPRRGNSASIVKLTSETKVPVAWEEIIPVYVRPKSI